MYSKKVHLWLIYAVFSHFGMKKSKVHQSDKKRIMSYPKETKNYTFSDVEVSLEFANLARCFFLRIFISMMSRISSWSIESNLFK